MSNRWIPHPPMKYIDALNIFIEACQERCRIAEHTGFPEPLQAPYKIAVPTSSLSSQLFSHLNLSDLASLFYYIIYMPDQSKDQWVKAFPFSKGSRIDVKKILDDAGFDTSGPYFDDQVRPYRYPLDENWFECLYYLLNNYLVYMCPLFSKQFTCRYRKFDLYTGEVSYESIVPTYFQPVFVSNVDGYKYELLERSLSLAYGVSNKSLPYFNTKVKYKITLFDEADQIAEYDQILDMKDGVSDAPSKALDYIDFSTATYVHEVWSDLEIQPPSVNLNYKYLDVDNLE